MKNRQQESKNWFCLGPLVAGGRARVCVVVRASTGGECALKAASSLGVVGFAAAISAAAAGCFCRIECCCGRNYYSNGTEGHQWYFLLNGP